MHDWFIDKVLTPMVGPTVGPIVDKIVATIISTIIGCFLFLYLCKRVFSQKQPKSILVIILFLTLILPRFTILRGNHVLLITLLGHWGIPFTRRMVNKFAKQTRPDNPKPPVHASRRTYPQKRLRNARRLPQERRTTASWTPRRRAASCRYHCGITGWLDDLPLRPSDSVYGCFTVGT